MYLHGKFSHFSKIFSNSSGDLNSWGWGGKPILQQNSFMIWSWGPLLSFNFNNMQYEGWTQILCHSLHFNAFCMIQHSFPEIFKISSNSKGEPNFFRGTNSAEQLNYLPPSLWRTQILHHSLDFNAFHMTKQFFSHIFKIFSNSRGGT